MAFGNPQRMKAVNEVLVREALIARGTATKAELSGDTGLSQTTVGQTLSILEAVGQIRQVGTLASSGGRPAASWAFVRGCVAGVAIVIREDDLVWARTDALGAVLERGTKSFDLDPVTGAARLAAELAARVDAGSASDLRDSRPGMRSVAVGVPGAVRDGRVLTGFLKEEWEQRDLGAWFEAAVGFPVVIENDLNAIALGYLGSLGTGPEAPRSLAYLHFNERCSGAGIVVDGKVVRGARNFAGEIGFLPMSGSLSFDDARASCAGDGEYADHVVSALAMVNCVVNPALAIIGGTAFRFDLAGEIRSRFERLVDGAVRPDLRFVDDGLSYYLSGLGRLAAGRALPTTRLIDSVPYIPSAGSLA